MVTATANLLGMFMTSSTEEANSFWQIVHERVEYNIWIKEAAADASIQRYPFRLECSYNNNNITITTTTICFLI